MAHEETVMELMQMLKVADKQAISSIMTARKVWSAGTSSLNNSYRALKNLADLGKLEQGNGWFRIPGCKSQYEQHAKALTKSLTKILILNRLSLIFREVTITEVGLRPDAIVLLINNNQGLCFVYEEVINETEAYYQRKVDTWEHWSGALPYLSQLTGYRIHDFQLVRQLDNFLKEALP